MSHLSFCICKEKLTGKGEDAWPSLLFSPEGSKTLLAVYDGMGGAGSQLYRKVPGFSPEEAFSGAYLGALLAKESLEEFFISQDFELEALSLFLESAFNQFALELESPPSKLKSRLIKTLPTTLAGIYLEDSLSDKPLQAQFFWAGDSRVFCLNPQEGLQQISKDDLNGNPDALENLRQDATLSNCLAAHQKLRLNARHLEFSSPQVFLAATDGCFAYLPSPMHFEYIVLKTLLESQYDVEDWQEKLGDHLANFAADDLSLVLFSWQIESLNMLKSTYLPRYQFLEKNFIQPWESEIKKSRGVLSQSTSPDRYSEIHEYKDFEETLWEQYKLTYYPKTSF